MDSATEIKNLLYRYAELIDGGQFDAIGEHFGDCTMTAEGTDMRLVGPEAIAGNYHRTTRIYPDGTPRTKHVITNLNVEVDEAAGTASMRSYYTVFQQTQELPLQPIISGRYHQTFARVEGRWRFKTHHFFVDLVGDLSAHLLFDLKRAT